MTPLLISIATLAEHHWPHVRAIYESGIETGNATFQTEAPSWESWNAGHLATCRFVALAGDAVIGWAALSPVSARPVYAGVCEVSVYVGATERGQGVGRDLRAAIIECSEGDGRWTLQAGIFPENAASLALHRSAGFRVIGRRERVGLLRGRWRDVLLLERRSGIVGVD